MRILSLLVLLGACGSLGSPQPEPDPSSFILDVAKISVRSEDGHVSLRAASKSVHPSAVSGLEGIWAIGLTTGAASAQVPVAADGSFALELAGTAGEPYRFHFDYASVDGAEYHTAVVDGFPNAEHGRLDWRMTCTDRSWPQYIRTADIAVGEAIRTPLVVVNHCERSITATAVRRVVGPGFVTTTLASPRVVTQLEGTNLDVVTSPARAGAFLEVIAIEFPDDAPLFITIKGNGRSP